MFQHNGIQSEPRQIFALDLMGISLLKFYRIDWIVLKFYTQII